MTSKIVKKVALDPLGVPPGGQRGGGCWISLNFIHFVYISGPQSGFQNLCFPVLCTLRLVFFHMFFQGGFSMEILSMKTASKTDHGKKCENNRSGNT